MKRADLIKTLTQAAADGGTTFERIRQGGRHEVWRYGAQQVIIPRHREINELTARGIPRDAGIKPAKGAGE